MLPGLHLKAGARHSRIHALTNVHPDRERLAIPDILELYLRRYGKSEVSHLYPRPNSFLESVPPPTSRQEGADARGRAASLAAIAFRHERRANGFATSCASPSVRGTGRRGPLHSRHLRHVA